MNRRNYLTAAGIIASSLSGCISGTSTSGSSPETLTVDGIYVYAHPVTKDEAPFDVQTKVVRDGETVYNKSNTIEKPTELDGFSLPDKVSGSTATYRVTVSPSFTDETESFDSKEFLKGISGESEKEACTFLRFRVMKSHVRPEPMFCNDRETTQ